MTPKYRTDAMACSCLGYWYRRDCRHYRAYRDAVDLVEAQNAVNLTLGYPKGRERRCTGLSDTDSGLGGFYEASFTKR